TGFDRLTETMLAEQPPPVRDRRAAVGWNRPAPRLRPRTPARRGPAGRIDCAGSTSAPSDAHRARSVASRQNVFLFSSAFCASLVRHFTLSKGAVMKRRVLSSLISLGAGAFLLHNSLAAQQPSVPEIPFDSVPNFLKLPADLYLGEASGVAVS